MKILMMSNSPLGGSAYSMLTRYISLMFKDFGHDVDILAYWGIDPSHPLTWNGMKLLPRKKDPWGRDVVEEYFKRTKADILMPIFDVWVLPELGKQCERVVAYSPTDHDPPSIFLHKAMKGMWKVIPFTNWAKKSLEAKTPWGDDGLKNVMDYIPHGLDLNIFKPKDKVQCRKNWNIKERHLDSFMIGIVAGNYDKEGRKRWDKQLEAIKIFRDQNPECNLSVYLHTDINNYIHGFDLKSMLAFFQLGDITYTSDPYYFITQLEYDRMGDIYNMFDVLMMCTSREGFGMPTIEAQACGVPVIGTNFAATQELTHKDLLVKVQSKIMTPIISWTSVPDAHDAAKKLEMLYKSSTKMKKYKKLALKNAQQYDWNGPLVRGKWVKALDKIEDALKHIKNKPKKKKEDKK